MNIRPNNVHYHYQAPLKPKKRLTKKYFIVAGAVSLLALLIVAGWLFFVRESTTAPSTDVVQQSQSAIEQPAEEPVQQLPNLQPVVDDWLATHNGIYTVKITDAEGNILAETDANQPFFAASLYKLFVAYVGYQKIDDGTHDPNQTYVNGWSRAKCLDEMIRSSDSPCAERLWNELGKEEVTTKMKELGIANTSLTAITTTANDSATMMRLIYNGTGLSDVSKQAYLDSLKTQEAKYRRGLPTGFTEATVYNKVGWNEDKEWHDSAIVELSNGKTIIIAVLTDGAGASNVAGLATAIQSALQ